MGKKKTIKTTIQQAVTYWSARVDECGLSVDWAEADKRCWRCGCERNLHRCHIIPDALGGTDEPSNIVLLCGRCHVDGPNVTDPDVMWDWIRAYSVPLYDTFWGIIGAKEYEFIYKKSVVSEMRDILAAAKVAPDSRLFERIKQLQREATESAGIHFGHPYFNAATMAGINRIMLKKLACDYQVAFPTEGSDIPESVDPWWL